jgi:4-hydroxy-tetrahydrodipicolinate synthase
MQALIGTGVALVTPFKEDFSRHRSIKKNCTFFDRWRNWVFGFGYNGWKCNIIPRWKEIVIKTVIEANNGSLPLVLGVGE